MSFMSVPPMFLYPPIHGIHQNNALCEAVSTFQHSSAQQDQMNLALASETEGIIVGNKNRQQIQRKKKLLKIKDPNTGTLIETRTDLNQFKIKQCLIFIK